MYGFEAEGAGAIVRNEVVTDPETIATAIRIGNPASWQKAIDARDESGGKIDLVTDDAITDAYKLLARREGVFAEPASCASIAGVIQQCENGTIPKGSKVVSVLTGNGLKDPQTAIDRMDAAPVTLPNDEAVVTDHIRKLVSV